jgi:hypothetical protein
VSLPIRIDSIQLPSPHPPTIDQDGAQVDATEFKSIRSDASTVVVVVDRAPVEPARFLAARRRSDLLRSIVVRTYTIRVRTIESHASITDATILHARHGTHVGRHDGATSRGCIDARCGQGEFVAIEQQQSVDLVDGT